MQLLRLKLEDSVFDATPVWLFQNFSHNSKNILYLENLRSIHQDQRFKLYPEIQCCATLADGQGAEGQGSQICSFASENRYYFCHEVLAAWSHACRSPPVVSEHSETLPFRPIAPIQPLQGKLRLRVQRTQPIAARRQAPAAV